MTTFEHPPTSQDKDPDKEKLRPAHYDDLVKSPKTMEYAKRYLGGDETVMEDLSPLWKDAIREAVVNISISENNVHAEDLTIGIEESIDVANNAENGLRAELLSGVDDLFTKPSAREVAKKNIESGKSGLYKYALTNMYNSIRKGDYDHADPLFHFDIDQITSQKSDLLKRVQIENGWHYRMPTTATSAQKSLGRISLNVAGNKQLIERLDVIAHKYGIYYKTPQGSSDWNERNDPVTVYINNPDLTPEQIEDLKQEIVSETEPFIRSNEGFGLYGDNISEGVEYGPESSSEKIQEILKEALEINQDLHDAIESYFTKGEKLKSSVGQNMAAQKLINRLKDAGAETI